MVQNSFYLIYSNRGTAWAGGKLIEDEYGVIESGHPDYACAASIVAPTRFIRIIPDKPNYIISCVIYTYDYNYNLVASKAVYVRGLSNYRWKTELDSNEMIIAVQFKLTAEAEQLVQQDLLEDIKFTVDFASEVHPHYKQLKIMYKREDEQAFFRQSLEGKLTLHGDDYLKVIDGSYETLFKLEVYKTDTMIRRISAHESIQPPFLINYPLMLAKFGVTDCSFDTEREICEPKLVYDDKYSQILDKYDNSYDLIKLAPAVTQLTLTKRAIVQIYVRGEDTISNYSNGNYWETEVEEAVDNSDVLRNTYHFAENGYIVQVHGQVNDWSDDYSGDQTSRVWNSVKVDNGEVVPGSLVFEKVADAATVADPNVASYMMSDGRTSNTYTDPITGQTVYRYDTYRLAVYTGNDGSGAPIAYSTYTYGKDYPYFLLSDTPNTFQMKVYSPLGFTGDTYYLDITRRHVWARILCDRDSVEINGVTRPLYDVPSDDFTGLNKNYKKCIGLDGIDSADSFIKIYVSTNQSETPSAYGLNSAGNYYNPPHSFYTANYYFYPLLRSIWGVASYWVYFNSTYLVPNGGFNGMCEKYNREFTLKDAWHIADVIKLLLNEIDPTIKHERSSTYSQYLYGHSGPQCASTLGNCDIYITPKSNILVSEYDRPAQKAELKFKQLMDMLRDCFRAYWYIDEDNRLIIEHVSYFDNGMSYNQSPNNQVSLLSRDKFNNKHFDYGQQKYTFDKSRLAARYEFNWMDDTTDAFGNLKVDFGNEYVQKDLTTEITIGSFTPDIDYMLFKPDDFSKDGFALLMADSNKKVPISEIHLHDERQPYAEYLFYSQNWVASFSNLISTYAYDMPGTDAHINFLTYYSVRGVKKFIKQSVTFPLGYEIWPYDTVQTTFGFGYIDSAKQDIETGIVEADLLYGIAVRWDR